jgi:hypothetical protein
MTQTTKRASAGDADEHSSYPVSMESIGWWDYATAERFTVDHPLAAVLAWAREIADLAATHDFTAMKRLACDLTMTRWFGCWRVELRADDPPYPYVPVELHEQTAIEDAHEVRARRSTGRFVLRQIKTVDGATWDCTGDDYLLAVATASAHERRRCMFDVVDVARVVPHGHRPTVPMRVLDLHSDRNPLSALVARRARYKTEARTLLRQAERLDPADPRHAARERRARQAARRAAVLRVVVNAIYGHTARYDAGGPYGFKPGPRAFPPPAAMIPAASRKRIGLVKLHAETLGTVPLALDTDGILLPVSPYGGEPVETLDGRIYRTLSYSEHDEVLSGFDQVALDDRGLWEVERTHDGHALWARSFGPKRYGIGVDDA